MPVDPNKTNKQGPRTQSGQSDNTSHHPREKTRVPEVEDRKLIIPKPRDPKAIDLHQAEEETVEFTLPDENKGAISRIDLPEDYSDHPETQIHSPLASEAENDQFAATQIHSPSSDLPADYDNYDATSIQPVSVTDRPDNFDDFSATEIFTPNDRDEAATGFLTGATGVSNISDDDFDFDSQVISTNTHSGNITSTDLPKTVDLARNHLKGYDRELEETNIKLQNQDSIFKTGNTEILSRLQDLGQGPSTVYGDYIVKPNSDNDAVQRLAEQFNVEFLKLVAKKKDDPSLDIEEKSYFGRMLNMATESLYDDDNTKMFLPVFETLFKRTFPENNFENPIESFAIFRELTREKMQAKITFSAQQLIQNMSQEDRFSIFKDRNFDLKRDDFDNQTIVEQIFSELNKNLDVDRDFINPNFFNNIYLPSFRNAVYEGLGTDRLKLIQTLSQVENTGEHRDLKKIITIAQSRKDKNADNGFEHIPELSAFASPPQLPSNEDQALKAIQRAQDSLVKELSEGFEVFKNLTNTELKEDAASWAMDVIKAIAQEKIDRIYPVVKNSLLKNPEFMKALKGRSSKKIQTILEQYVPEEVLKNPLRKYLFAKTIDQDFQFKDAVSKVPNVFQRMAQSTSAKLGTSLMLLSGAGYVANDLAVSFQNNRDPYSDSSVIEGFKDTVPVLADSFVKSTQDGLKSQQTWVGKETFSAEELFTALETNNLVKNDSLHLLATILEKSSIKESLEKNNPNIFSLDIDPEFKNNLDTEAVTEELLQQLNSNTELLNELNEEEQLKFAQNIVNSLEAIFRNFKPLKTLTPGFLIEASIEHPSKPGQKVNIALQNKNFLKKLLIDLDKEDSDARKNQLRSLNNIIAFTGRSMTYSKLVTSTFEDYLNGNLDFSKLAIDEEVLRVNSSDNSSNTNKTGYAVDNFRRSINKETLH